MIRCWTIFTRSIACYYVAEQETGVGIWNKHQLNVTLMLNASRFVQNYAVLPHVFTAKTVIIWGVVYSLYALAFFGDDIGCHRLVYAIGFQLQ